MHRAVACKKQGLTLRFRTAPIQDSLKGIISRLIYRASPLKSLPKDMFAPGIDQGDDHTWKVLELPPITLQGGHSDGWNVEGIA
jgi:hypothetical protein